jgi:hypothetical protein
MSSDPVLFTRVKLDTQLVRVALQNPAGLLVFHTTNQSGDNVVIFLFGINVRQFMNKNDQNIAFKMVYFVDESGPK